MFGVGGGKWIGLFSLRMAILPIFVILPGAGLFSRIGLVNTWERMRGFVLIVLNKFGRVLMLWMKLCHCSFVFLFFFPLRFGLVIRCGIQLMLWKLISNSISFSRGRKDNRKNLMRQSRRALDKLNSVALKVSKQDLSCFLDENETCCVCLEELRTLHTDEVRVLPCRHAFHS